MALFRRSKSAPQAGPPATEMRGRAAEIADPGALDWEVVWEALKTEPPAESPSTLTQELGMGEERELVQKHADMPATEFSGTRNGRRAALRIGMVPSAIRERAVNEVQVEAPVAPFSASADKGRLVVEPGAPAEVENVVAGLAPAPKVWRDLDLEGGQDGLVARRPVAAHSQGYVYDLWLLERLADELGA